MRARRGRGRPFRRILRPLRRRRFPPRGPLTRGPLRRLRRAHALRASGDLAASARILEELAWAAQDRGHPQAAKLALSAGRAWIEAGETGRGVTLLQAGLGLMAASAPPERLQRVLARVIEELARRGLTAEAGAIEASMREPEIPFEPGARTPTPGLLPAKCPHCGGSVRGDEVEWIDTRQALCDYCGSTLQAMS